MTWDKSIVVYHAGVMALTPDGANLYVGRPEDTAMNRYAVNTSTGALSGETVYDVYSYVTDIEVSPDGTDLYVTDWLGAIVYRFVIGAGGALTSAGGGATGSYPSGVDLTPDGKCLLVSNAINEYSGSVSGFRVDAAGALTSSNTLIDQDGIGDYPTKIAVGR